MMPFMKGRSTKPSGEKAFKIPVTAYLLDNLWLWAIVIFIIALIYGAWALIESVNMHTPPGIGPK